MRGRRVCGFVLAFIIAGGLNGFAAGPAINSQALGLLTGRDPAWVNNQPALPGTALYPGDVITTGEASTLQLNFRPGITATLSGSSELALSHEPSPAHLNLRRGSVLLQSETGQTAHLNVGATSVYVQGKGGFPAICRIAALGSITTISNQRGRVLIQRMGTPVLLPAGKSVRLEAGAPQGGGQQAGKVAAEIPHGFVQRAGQTAEMPLDLNDPVYWNDEVLTHATGRLRLELLDGSTMNIGARSTMRVVKHDPQSQQTEIELKLGRMRSEVVKLTKPDAKYEVRTQTAVIGVVGTVHEIRATQDSTYLWCIIGLCTARNINPLVQGVVNLTGGQFSLIPRNGPPSVPAASSPGDLNAQTQGTDMGGGGGGSGFNVGANAATSVVTAAAAGLLGVAATGSSDASSASSTAAGILEGATTTNNTAAGSAGGAGSSEGQIGAGLNGILQNLLSPSEPGCNCR
jgi:ferric-dicitrate binding protein FerR (iron transport regulator)